MCVIINALVINVLGIYVCKIINALGIYGK